MNFCEDCDNMLYMHITDDEEGKHVLKYFCRCCNNTYDHTKEDDSCVFNINFNIDNIKKNSNLNKYIYNDITLPKADGIKCPNKQCPTSKPEIVYIQYDKEDMKYIYICLDCYKANIEPHVW